MELQSAVNLIVLLAIIWIALRLWRRERVTPRLANRESTAAEAALLDEPAAVTKADSNLAREPAAAPLRRTRASFGDRIFGGAAAGSLIAAIVFTLEVSGYGGPLSSVLAMALSTLPAPVKGLDPLFGGALLVGAVSFVLGFLFPRLVTRVRRRA